MEKYIPVLLVLIQTQISYSQSSAECDMNEFNKVTKYENNLFIAGSECVCKTNLNLQEKKCAKHDLGYIKVLLPFQDNIIICGTRNGICQIRKINDLYSWTSYQLESVVTNKTSTRVVSKDPSKRTVAFIGSADDDNESVLYTASQQNQDNTSSLISVRDLTEKPFELYNQNGLGSQIELTWNETIRKRYYELFDPIGGFIDNGWAYFFANQFDSFEKGPVAKLIRVCQEDSGKDRLFTYQDIRMTCTFKVNALVDVVRVPLGTSYRGMVGEDSRLLGIFRNTTHDVLCTYPFKTISTLFGLARRRVSSSYLRISRNASNKTTGKEPMCNKELKNRNFISLSSYVLNEFRPIIFPNNITYSTASLINEDRHSLVLLAYDKTFIRKVFIGKDKPYVFGLPMEVDVGEIKALTIIDDRVIVLNATEMSEHPLFDIETCAGYKKISTCIIQEDPYCGWCVDTQECTILRHCPSNWVPIILGDFTLKSFFPKIGPMAGGTRLVFTGENIFASSKGLEIYIGTGKCSQINKLNETTLECFTPESPEVQIVNISYTLNNTDSLHVNLERTFSYLENPTVSGITPNRTFESGGRNLTVTGQNFEVIQHPRIQIIGANISEGCLHSNNSVIVCMSPEATAELKARLEDMLEATGERRRSTDDYPMRLCGNDTFCVSVEFQMDGVNTSLLRQTIEYARDPVFHNFTEEDMTKDYHRTTRNIAIEGDRINVAASVHDFSVKVGIDYCQVVAYNFSRYQLRCVPPPDEPHTRLDASPNPEVLVEVGNIKRHVGFLRYHHEPGFNIYLALGMGVLAAVLMVLLVLGIVLWHRNRHVVKKLQSDMELMETRIHNEFRQAFADLQTDMTDITGELVETGLPYNKFPVYAFQILFPNDDVTNMRSHKIFHYPQTHHDVSSMDKAMIELDALFQNRFFVLSVIDTLEQQKKLSMSEKSGFAAFLAALMIGDLNYFAQLIKDLLENQITAAVKKNRHKSLFRRCESITEKLTSLWLEIVLHQHVLKNRGGSALIMLVKAIQTVMMKSPIDDVTHAARATLSYEQLLLCQVEDDHTINVTVQINGGEHQCKCSLLACDTIGQVKNKCLGALYKKDHFSTRPKAEDVDIQWHCGKQGRLVLEEQDVKPSDDQYRKLMTLADYHVTDGALLELLQKKTFFDHESEYENLSTIQHNTSNSEIRPLVENDTSETGDVDGKPNKIPKYHLVKPEPECQEKNKLFAEVHLQKLLQTKLNVKKYVDEAIDSALDKKDIPIVVKFVFTVLDQLASSLKVDNDTLISWKNNCYPVRFWNLLMSRPQIVFDIDVPKYLQPSLIIVASTFLDCFSPPQTLSKNSAPHKLLFFKDLEESRHLVKSFHRAVSNTALVDERELAQEISKLTYMQSFKVNKTAVYYQLFQVLLKFKEEIFTDLDENKSSSRLGLSEKLKHVMDILEEKSNG